jgi:hypothetical protein
MAAREDDTLTTPHPDTDQITILMGLHNGATYLDAQLQSIAEQTHTAWRLVIGDDGSHDSGPAQVQAFAARYPAGQISQQQGPCQGFAANYLTLLASLPEHPGWIAFADQDDVWLPERLSAGLHGLQGITGPTLCAGPVWRVAHDLSGRTLSGGWSGPTGFANALVQNVAQGNTMLANPDAARLLVKAARACLAAQAIPVAHDWWAYQIVTGGGGQLAQIPQPTVLYRQHGGNAIGAQGGAHREATRLARLLAGTQRRWSATNIKALSACAPLLSPQAQSLLEGFQTLHSSASPLTRLRLLRRLGLYRQGRLGRLSITLAALLGRV